MSEMNVNQVLAQMRAMSAEAANQPEQQDDSGEFSALLKQSIDTVNETQQAASNMAQAFEMGADDVSLSQVMVSAQKASVSFQAMVQVRNKLVEAYQDVMNMPM